MKRIAYLALLWLLLTAPFAWAQGFVVNDIKVEGLQNISAATVNSYLPVKRGQTLSSAQTAKLLHALYGTGFFDHISLSKEGHTLIISVVERPMIGDITITGNSVITSEKLTSVMKSLDIAKGHVYNPVIVDKIKQSLLNQYYQLGYYNARVDVSTVTLPRHRVNLTITISEGLIAKIRRISILGNKLFDDKTLIKQLEISPSGLFTYITQSDRYSEERLQSSIDKIRAYYMDHGYLRVEVKSSQAQITPDRKSVYVTFIVNEGAIYKVSKMDVTGHLVLPKADYEKVIHIAPGDVFSRQKIVDGEKAITDMLGNKGYLFATVSIKPDVDDKTHTVALVFEVIPGRRVYVRHVTFTDNNRTNDVVLRREVQQMEGSPASTSNIQDSKQRLSLLPYLKTVDLSILPVPGVDNQIDVNYKVKEEAAATASFKVGLAQQYGVILGAGVNQKNFFGTGNTLGVNFSHSQYEQTYGIDYTNPYYTPDGISRSFSFLISKVDPKAAGINNGYTTDEYNAGMLFGIPIGQERGVYSRISAGLSYQNTLINLIPGNVPNQVNTFITQHGRRYQELDVKLGISRDSRDRAIFPTSGTFQTLFFDGFIPLDGDSLAFYTLNYSGKWYQPLYGDFILLSRTNLGYGNGWHGIDDFPFFKNYYAGGIDSVRGFRYFTLGPRDSNDNPYGGNMLADASVGVIFPNYISENLRTNVFFDIGNVYGSGNNRNFGGGSTTSGPFRYSVGVEGDLITPMGPIVISLAKPLNARGGSGRGDKTEVFQFALGANF